MSKRSIIACSFVLLFTLFFPILLLSKIAKVAVDPEGGDFDDLFRKYSRTYFGRLDWRYFKSQAFAESSLNPKAKSHAGALGLMQLMPATYNEVRTKVSLSRDPYHVESNIHAGILYNLQQYNKWTEKRSSKDRLALMFASYNAGFGNIYRAQRLERSKGRPAVKWVDIRKSLPEVTGRHAKDTTKYVEKIFYMRTRL
ncbi:MAG: transglycosylase SLT domain-containing protein [Verrucomicrobiota bacterium]